MESNTTTLKLLTDLLAEMTARAIKAEEERDAEKERADTWYKYYQKQEATVTEAKMLLEKEMEDHQHTLQKLRKLEGGTANA